jgi:hypothetical protein
VTHHIFVEIVRPHDAELHKQSNCGCPCESNLPV